MAILNAYVFSDMENGMVAKPKVTYEYIMQSILEQGSLYPIFPSTSPDFPVEYKYEERLALKSIPDVLIVQSTQPCFIHVLYSLRLV